MENITPATVISAISIDQRYLEVVTREFIEIKETYFPNLSDPSTTTRLGRILPEIKGADLRRAMREGSARRNRRQAFGVLDALMRLMEDYEIRVFGRIWIKPLGEPCKGRAIYTFSVQDICATFQNHLEAVGEDGFIIADSRTPTANAEVSHSIFTQKFKTDGDRYPRILEMPTFGHSQNHAGLQIADLVCSAMLFPMVTYRFCGHASGNVHVNEGFSRTIERYGHRLRALQHRYRDDTGKWRGGITMSDPVGCKPGSLLFRL